MTTNANVHPDPSKPQFQRLHYGYMLHVRLYFDLIIICQIGGFVETLLVLPCQISLIGEMWRVWSKKLNPKYIWKEEESRLRLYWSHLKCWITLEDIRREYLNIRYSTLSTTKGTTEIKLSYLTAPYCMIKLSVQTKKFNNFIRYQSSRRKMKKLFSIH